MVRIIWNNVGKALSMTYGLASEKAMVPHSSTLAQKIPWTEEPGRLQSMGSRRLGHDWTTSLSLFTFMHWRRKWHPMGEPGGLPSLGSHRVGHDWSDLAAAAAAAWPSMPWVLNSWFFPLSDSKPKYCSFSFTAYYETFSCTTIR